MTNKDKIKINLDSNNSFTIVTLLKFENLGITQGKSEISVKLFLEMFKKIPGPITICFKEDYYDLSHPYEW